MTLQDSGAYQVKNAQSGQCMDVFYSSQTSGALVGQYTCTGTTNQQWTITRSGSELRLTAKHSGLSRRSVTQKLQKYELDRTRFKNTDAEAMGG